ncbi:MAG: MFS transporter [Acetobacteraceae bacterium]
MPTEPTDLDPQRWRALPVLLTGSFLSFLDFFIVNIALPAMQDDLGAQPAQLQLVVAGYGIGFAVSLVTGGRLGDIYGRKRVFLWGLSGFTLASALCGLAINPQMLILMRILQAVTAAMLTPQVLAIIRIEFAVHERATAVGLYGTSMGFASIAAQIFGGSLVTLDLFGLSWRLIFLINVPIGLAAILLATRILRESRSKGLVTLDLPGTGLVSLALLLLIYPLVEGRQNGWPIWAFAMLGAAIPAFVIFISYQKIVARKGRTPLIALHLLRVPTIAFGLLVSMIFFSGLAAFFVVLTITFQTGLGYSALSTGMLFLPFALGFSGASALSGRVASVTRGRTISLGSLLMILALTGLISLVHAPWGDISSSSAVGPLLVAVFLIYGLGQGFAQPGFIHLVTAGAGVSEADAGSASGLFLTTAQSSLALGVAAIGDVFFSWLGPAPGPEDYAMGLVAALTCNLALQVLTFLLVLLLPRVNRLQRGMSASSDGGIRTVHTGKL